MNSDQETEFDDIPGMPNDDELRDELVKTGSPYHWNPFNGGPRDPDELANLPEEAAKRVLDARSEVGPGPNGNKYQRAIHDRYRRTQELGREYERLDSDLNEVGGYDPGTGEEIPAIQSPQRRRAMRIRMQEIAGEMGRIKGEPGDRKLEKALNEAIKDRKVAFRRQYIQTEAKRRAAQSNLDAEIERAAEGYRKAGGAK